MVIGRGNEQDGAMWKRGLLLLAMTLSVSWLVSCSGATTSTGPSGTSGSASPSATPSSTGSPSPSLSPSPTGPPTGFACAGTHGGVTAAADWPPEGPRVVAVRVGAHEGFDRIVFEFSGTVPSYTISRQSTSFRLDPAGGSVTVKGTRGLLVTIKPEDWLSYRGPQRFQAGLPFLREARMVQNFEGIMQWGLGVAGTPCLRVTTLSSPPRLVVDVSTK